MAKYGNAMIGGTSYFDYGLAETTDADTGNTVQNVCIPGAGLSYVADGNSATITLSLADGAAGTEVCYIAVMGANLQPGDSYSGSVLLNGSVVPWVDQNGNSAPATDSGVVGPSNTGDPNLIPCGHPAARPGWDQGCIIMQFGTPGTYANEISVTLTTSEPKLQVGRIKAGKCFCADCNIEAPFQWGRKATARGKVCRNGSKVHGYNPRPRTARFTWGDLTHAEACELDDILNSSDGDDVLLQAFPAEFADGFNKCTSICGFVTNAGQNEISAETYDPDGTRRFCIGRTVAVEEAL